MKLLLQALSHHFPREINYAPTHPVLANLADQRFWCFIFMAACALVGVGVSTLFALFRVPPGERGAFLSRVRADVGVAMFASLWSSLLLAACVFMLFAIVALLLPLPERQAVFWLFPLIWAICYMVMACIWIRRVFRDALAPPDDRPWVIDEDDVLPPKSK